MINNIQDLFLKYKNKLNSKKEIENKTILFFKENFNLEIDSKNLKIDIKNKTVSLINIKSSLRFFIKNKIKEEDNSLFKEKINFNLLI